MTTDSTLVSELRAHEPIMHRSPPHSDRKVLESLLAPDFFEVGASGTVYSREVVLDVVERRYADGTDPDDDVWTVEDFAVRTLSDDTALVTYHLVFAGRPSRRSTIWTRHGSGWRAIYHQGTVCDTPATEG